MTEHTYHDLKHKKLVDLKEIAKEIEHEAVQGYTQMNKDHLLEAICKALNIDMFEHHVATGLEKTGIKTRIKALKDDREKAIEAKDYKKLKSIRKQIKRLKKKLRRASV
jgi:protein-arginine kinase activator protein McsA